MTPNAKRQKWARISATGIVVLALWGLGSNCARERAIEPQPVESVIFAGGSYFRDSSNTSFIHVLYLLDGSTFQRIDSLLFESSIVRLLVSDDGRKLFGQSAGDVLIVDAATHRIQSRLPNAILQTVIKNGQEYLARLGPGYATSIVDTDDGTVVHDFDSTHTFFHSKCNGTEIVSWVNSGTDRFLTVIDLESKLKRGRYHPRLQSGDPLAVRFAVLHPNGRHVLSIGPRNSSADSWFVIGDVDSDSTLLEHRLIYDRGEVAISYDGRWAAVTDPSSAFHDSQRNLSVFDLSAMTLIKRFVEPEIDYPDQVRFLPGTSTIAVYPTPPDEGPLQIVGVGDASVVATIWLPLGDSIRGPGGFFTSAFDVASSSSRR